MITCRDGCGCADSPLHPKILQIMPAPPDLMVVYGTGNAGDEFFHRWTAPVHCVCLLEHANGLRTLEPYSFKLRMKKHSDGFWGGTSDFLGFAEPFEKHREFDEFDDACNDDDLDGLIDDDDPHDEASA